MINWPSVTAIIPTKERTELLPRALTSILEQHYPGNLECIVVFDQAEREVPHDVGSSDRVRYLLNDRTAGPAGARNAAAFAATGEFLAFCDDDDEWLPEKLRLQIEAIENRPGTRAATCGIEIHHRGRVLRRAPRGELIGAEEALESRAAELHMSTLVVRRAAFLDEIGPLDEKTPGGYGEDYDWLLRATQLAPVVAVPRFLVRVYWGGSWFADRWPMIIAGIEYQLKKHPELASHPRNLSRMYGRLAFAMAAQGRRAEARRWAARSLRLDWRQARGYLALLVSSGPVRAERIVRLVNYAGKGI
jgi:glycosyltransferase involved in cell wall biosynthesis